MTMGFVSWEIKAEHVDIKIFIRCFICSKNFTDKITRLRRMDNGSNSSICLSVTAI